MIDTMLIGSGDLYRGPCEEMLILTSLTWGSYVYVYTVCIYKYTEACMYIFICVCMYTYQYVHTYNRKALKPRRSCTNLMQAC